MAGNRTHFDDLKRRYREADWVSEYQRLWAIFNHWLIGYTAQTNDRQSIEILKTDPNLGIWVRSVISRTEFKKPHRLADGYGDSFPRFASNNEISHFFRTAVDSETLEPRIYMPWSSSTEARVKLTCTLTLEESQFREVYRSHAAVLYSEEGIVYSQTLHEILPALGIGTTGCCFFRDPIPADLSTNTKALADLTLIQIRRKPELSIFVQLIDWTNPTILEADIIETLYNLRNVAMHGALDFLQPTDNAVARAGYDLLDSLIRNIRDNW